MFSERKQKYVSEKFAQRYYNNYDRTWTNTRWFGVDVYKLPLDLWIYQELLYEQQPELIVETGTAAGGSAYYLAHLCDLLGVGEIVTVDIDASDDRPEHPRISYLTGSSLDPGILDTIGRRAAGKRVLVVLDSDHSRDHVLKEMRAYAPLVQVGGYMIVEDTNVNGHPVNPSHGPGPWEAVDAFLAETNDFVPDLDCEKFLMTFNPRGYLRRVK